jgi:hypothetical protein
MSLGAKPTLSLVPYSYLRVVLTTLTSLKSTAYEGALYRRIYFPLTHLEPGLKYFYRVFCIGVHVMSLSGLGDTLKQFLKDEATVLRSTMPCCILATTPTT